MILLAALLVSQCCGSAAAEGSAAALERIEDCGNSCSQGLQCKAKSQMFPPPCQNPAGALSAASVFRNVSATTVMRCKGRQKCRLHLKISTDLQLTETIRGVSICAATTGIMVICRTLSFTKASRERLSGMQVKVTNDCTQVSPGQHFEIKVQTVPSYCGVVWTGTYVAPGCNTEDLKQHVPDCITGKLSYDVNAESKELAVSVSDMLEGHDYHLRLCHKDFICTGTGAKTLIRKEEPVKKALLQYSRPLPCLCIEGWSAVTDASRVQVCPFKDRLEELWSGISFQPLEGLLWWEPACPVAATVTLCQRREEDVCVDLPHSSHSVSRGKITFSKVDPHPRLCMKFSIRPAPTAGLTSNEDANGTGCSGKGYNPVLNMMYKFTAGSQYWIRCPFADARFQEWEVVVRGPADVQLLTQSNATFSVGLCVTGECQTVETHILTKQKAVAINVPAELCNSCLQVKRIDVQFAITDVYCMNEYTDQKPSIRPLFTHQAELNLSWIFALVAVLLGVILLALLCHLFLNVYHRRKQKRNKDYTCDQQTDSALECVIPVLQAKPVSSQSEKVNLISD